MATSPNVFDQFDGANVFDQFDSGPAALTQKAPPESLFHQAVRGLLSVPDIAVTGVENIPYATLSSAYDLGQRVTGHAGEAQPAWIRALQAHLAPATQQTIREAANLPGIRQAGQAVQAADQRLGQVSPTLQDIVHQGIKVGGDVANLTGGLQVADSLGRGAVNAASEALKPTPKAPAPPTKDELGEAASAAYKRAENAGVTVTPESFAGLQKQVAGSLNPDEIDVALHPSTVAVSSKLASIQGPVTLQRLETLRRVVKGAVGDATRAGRLDDARLAGGILDQIDNYTENLGKEDVSAGDPEQAVQALQDARNLYSRNRKADVMDQLVQRAGDRAGQFSGSGFENALRTEFRQLALNSKRMRTFTPEEQDAIRLVARGGTLDNLARYFGKFAPRGVVSTALGMGAGAMLHGLVGAGEGGLAALTVPALGEVARNIATQRTLANIERASAIMRRGPQGSAPLTRPMSVGGPLASPEPAQVASGLLSPSNVVQLPQRDNIEPAVQRASSNFRTSRKPPGIAELLRKAAIQSATPEDEQKLIDAGYAVRTPDGDFILRPRGPRSKGTLAQAFTGTD